MNLEQLTQEGGFVDAALVKKRITWHKSKGQPPVQFDVHIEPQPFGVVEKIMSLEDGQSRSAHVIALAVRLGEGGAERMTYDQAYRLAPSLAWALVGAINEVNEKN